MFGSAQAGTYQRCLKRYITTAQEAMNKATEPLEKEGLLRQLRRLQAVDSCSRMYLG